MYVLCSGGSFTVVYRSGIMAGASLACRGGDRRPFSAVAAFFRAPYLSATAYRAFAYLYFRLLSYGIIHRITLPVPLQRSVIFVQVCLRAHGHVHRQSAARIERKAQHRGRMRFVSHRAGELRTPGFGQRGIEGKIIAAHYTRTHDIPTFGICLGMQMMVIEFARNVLGYKDANSREMDEKTPHNVIDIMEEQKNISNMGGTMRLGAYECVLKQGSRVFNIYKKEHIQERHRHRYEFNNEFQQEFEKNGMMCVGRNPESDLVEIVEIPGLKWYVGTQYHPEYQSTVLKPHPLFMDFVKTAIENKK